jgi:hypothetical protein
MVYLGGDLADGQGVIERICCLFLQWWGVWRVCCLLRLAREEQPGLVCWPSLEMFGILLILIDHGRLPLEPVSSA